MIFADHIQGIDSRIQLQKIRLWNTSTGFVDSVAVAGVSESDKYGTLIYSTLTGENDLRYYGQTDGSTSRWSKGTTLNPDGPGQRSTWTRCVGRALSAV